MKCTLPTRTFCVCYPMQPIFHRLALGFCVRGNKNFRFDVRGKANFRIFRYQHVGIGNARLWHWVSRPTAGPNANGFASQRNIGFKRAFLYNLGYLSDTSNRRMLSCSQAIPQHSNTQCVVPIPPDRPCPVLNPGTGYQSC